MNCMMVWQGFYIISGEEKIRNNIFVTFESNPNERARRLRIRALNCAQEDTRDKWRGVGVLQEGRRSLQEDGWSV